MKDFDWTDVRAYRVQVAAQHEGSKIFFLAYEPDDIDSDMGFDPYLGCYTDDC